MGCGASTDAKKPQEPVVSNDPELYKKVHSQIRWNKIDEVKALVTNSSTANLQDPNNGNYCIHIAAQNGHTDLVKMLIAKGANPNAQNNSGHTPLHMVVSYQIQELISFLKTKGADENIKNNDGFAAKHGLDGQYDPTSNAGRMFAFEEAKTEGDLVKALAGLSEIAAELDKVSVIQKGLKVKKANKDAWTATVQTRFQELLSELK